MLQDLVLQRRRLPAAPLPAAREDMSPAHGAGYSRFKASPVRATLLFESCLTDSRLRNPRVPPRSGLGPQTQSRNIKCRAPSDRPARGGTNFCSCSNSDFMRILLNRLTRL